MHCIDIYIIVMFYYFTPQACQTEQGLSDVAAAAEQLQPKGITLSTTKVILGFLFCENVTLIHSLVVVCIHVSFFSCILKSVL